jgi:hypothetical protein
MLACYPYYFMSAYVVLKERSNYNTSFGIVISNIGFSSVLMCKWTTLIYKSLLFEYILHFTFVIYSVEHCRRQCHQSIRNVTNSSCHEHLLRYCKWEQLYFTKFINKCRPAYIIARRFRLKHKGYLYN